MTRKGHKGHHSKKGSGSWRTPQVIPKKHELVTATKQAQNWAKIIDALPDEETKQLALAEYAKIGERRLGS